MCCSFFSIVVPLDILEIHKRESPAVVVSVHLQLLLMTPWNQNWRLVILSWSHFAWRAKHQYASELIKAVCVRLINDTYENTHIHNTTLETISKFWVIGSLKKGCHNVLFHLFNCFNGVSKQTVEAHLWAHAFVKQCFCWADSNRVCLSVVSCCISSGEGVSRKGSGGAGTSSHSQVPGVWISTTLFPLVPWRWTPNLQFSRETQTRYCPHSYKHVHMTSTGSLKTSQINLL